jgi:hypothetical protein
MKLYEVPRFDSEVLSPCLYDRCFDCALVSFQKVSYISDQGFVTLCRAQFKHPYGHLVVHVTSIAVILYTCHIAASLSIISRFGHSLQYSLRIIDCNTRNQIIKNTKKNLMLGKIILKFGVYRSSVPFLSFRSLILFKVDHDSYFSNRLLAC